MFDKLCKKYLPIYFRFWPTSYWLAIWSAPVRYNGEWKVDGEWKNVYRSDSSWAALRITIRKGEHHSLLVRSIKKGTV